MAKALPSNLKQYQFKKGGGRVGPSKPAPKPKGK